MEIGDLYVRQLSGLVSFKYLFPKKEAFDEKADEGIFLPIIILIGDRHHSEDGRCEPCDEKEDCYLVESDTFLQTLNQIADSVPVDFYTEHAPKDEKRKKPPSKGVLFEKFIGKVDGCHQKKLRGTREYKCNFPNVRWHYSDTRLWTGQYENELSVVNGSLDYLTQPTTDLSFGYRLLLSPLFQQFLFCLLEVNRGNLDNKKLAKQLSGILKDSIRHNQRTSRVYKQLAKSKLDIGIEMYCYFSLEYHGVASPTSTLRDILPNVQLLPMVYNYIFGGEPLHQDYLEQCKMLIQGILILWIKFTACLLDIYFLARMLKTPKDNINSYLTVAFFGTAHCESIANYLTDNLRMYELKYSTEEADRCVRVNGNINFNKDLEMYSKWRIIRQKITPYTNRLETERLGM